MEVGSGRRRGSSRSVRGSFRIGTAFVACLERTTAPTRHASDGSTHCSTDRAAHRTDRASNGGGAAAHTAYDRCAGTSNPAAGQALEAVRTGTWLELGRQLERRRTEGSS